MLLWIALGIIALVSIAMMFEDGILGAVLGGCIALLAFLVIGSLGAFFSYESSSSTSTQDLVAVAAKDTVEGKSSGGIFGSYGYVDGKRVISYTAKTDDGGVKLAYADAEDSVVYEVDDEKPRIVTTTKEFSNWVFAPWTYWEHYEHKIYVPKGSVVESFTVAP